MRVVNHTQGTPEWLAWRNGGIGSSDAMVIAAAHGMVERKPWMKDLDDLFREKMTGISEVIENSRMQRGKDGEAAARNLFEKTTGIVVSPVCAEMDEIPELKASYDGLSFDGLMIVEIKCPHEKIHALAKQSEIVDYYKPQVCHQGIVAWGDPAQWPDEGIIYFESFMPETGEGFIVKKTAKEMAGFAAELFVHEKAFLECLRSGVAPCGDDYMTLARRYQAIEQRIKEATEIKEALRDAIIAMAIKRKVDTIDGGGVTVSNKSKTGSIDYAKLCAHYNITETEQESYRKPGSTFWQIRVDPKLAPPDVDELSASLDSVASATKIIDASADDFWGSFGSAPVPMAPRQSKAA